jgi:hypothetical protein
MTEIIINGKEIKQRILTEISNSQKSIYIAMAWFTDKDIAARIVEAKSRFPNIDIILSSNTQNETVKEMFEEAGISVHAFETGDTRGIMHHKFCLIDNNISINGSYNYSYNASTNNVENIHISDDLSLYSQLYAEFERLKYNIDNNITVNTTIEEPEKKVEKVKPDNVMETFSQQLNNLVYSAAQINTEDYHKKGFDTSKDCSGHIDIFKVEYDNIKEVIKAYATDDSLGGKKTTLIANVSNAYESMKGELDSEKTRKTEISKRNNETEKRQFIDKLSAIKNEKSILESGNENTGEKGLIQVNKDIEKNTLERRSLERSFVVKKFWSIGTVLVLFLLTVFICYLSVFFASALFKTLFEGNAIRAALEAGINPGLPKLVDANAIVKIYSQEGVLFGFIATILFMFPVLLSNLKLLGSENKLVNNLLFGVGLLIFDIVVAALIAINTDEIKSLLVGKESELKLWEVVKEAEFWMIFMFGMVPLIITHYLIKNISDAYKNSKREMVDAEKDQKIRVLDEDLIDLNSAKESLNNRINIKEEEIRGKESDVQKLETSLNNELSQLETQYALLNKQVKSISEDINARIVSGKIFTDVIFDTVIAAYKSGFVEYLPRFYAPNEVAIRIKEIERIISN